MPIRFIALTLCVLTWLLSCEQPLVAQDRAADPPRVEIAPVTRADLSWAYMRLEQTYFNHLPTDEERVIEINKAFDAATRNFFSGKYAETIAEINRLSASLLSDNPTVGSQIAMSLKANIEPPVLHLDRPQPLRIVLSSIYETALSGAEPLQLELRPLDENGTAGTAVIGKPLSFAGQQPGQVNVSIEIPPTPELVPGAYAVVLADADQTTAIAVGQLNVVSRSLDVIRQENKVKLAAIAATNPELADAIRACGSRNDLLQDNPDAGNSSQFLSDLHRLSGEISAEIEALSAGNDPYRRRAGDYWRTFSTDGKDKAVPARVYAPPTIIGDQPVPLVIVLHGAGGDENMFFAGYGAGKIKSLADQHGFLAVAPATTLLGGRAERFDAMLEQLAEDYAIDPDAIYLMGHSMGGFTTVTLVSRRGEKLAAACCLAGGGNPGAQEIPPMLIIAAELDAIVPGSMLEIGAQQAIEAGLPVKFQRKENYGHTLMVGAVLEEAVQWLLKHRREPPAATDTATDEPAQKD